MERGVYARGKECMGPTGAAAITGRTTAVRMLASVVSPKYLYIRGNGFWAEARREVLPHGHQSISRSGSVGASNDASAQKTCRPPGCAEIGLGLRCSVGRVSLGIHSLLRASPQANFSATNVYLFERHHTNRHP